MMGGLMVRRNRAVMGQPGLVAEDRPAAANGDDRHVRHTTMID
jgi:hypothetical protein